MKRSAGKFGLRIVLAAAGLSVGALAFASESSPVGAWKTIDDKSGKVKSIVQITETNGELQGVVTKVFSPPAESENPVCEKCEGERKDKPVIGMTIMSGLRKTGEEYTGGQILDPAEGKIYKCKVKVAEDGKTLQMRGFIGFSLLGRTQTWVRDQ
ncbi:MAG TPA: DUF2147 domain-containing protein [Burkholderiales bacterium]|nr:DUF2147 domain-containing protein [Burkholderiales bacterium]